MPYVNQLKLIEKGVKKNRDFLKSLYECETLTEANKWFDKLEGKVQREPDSDMTIAKFLKHMSRKSYTIFQLASPTPFEIRYCAMYRDDAARRHFFLECPYNDHHFEIVSGLFTEAFGTRLEDEPVPEGIIDYYKQRVKSRF